MIVYSATKAIFTEDVQSNAIEKKILGAYKRGFGRSTSLSEIRSWKNSMVYMNNALQSAGVPHDAGVYIEYRIPQSAKRVDFILTGRDSQKKDTAIIVELKQWSNVSATTKDAVVSTYVGKGVREVEHPSYQAWTYAALLYDFNETVRDEDIQLHPCAYLHNCEDNDVINSSFYKEHTAKAPSFLRDDVKRLAAFLKKFVRYGDSTEIMYRIENGRISPSKNLADKLLSLLQGNQEFIMIDDQKVVYETALHLAAQSTATKKHVLIIEGGPGTGKSVVAINLLVELTKRKLVAQYVTKNAAPRNVYESKLTGSFKKSHISNMFKGSGSYTECAPHAVDVLVVDEAHRLNAKSGMFQHLGENQIKEIIRSAKLSIFFIDEDQRVTFKDIGEKQEILRWAVEQGADVEQMELSSQFRCNGSNGYLAWLDQVLQVRSTANDVFDRAGYDIQVVDSPNDLKDIILRKNRLNNSARLVAGYCWNWVTKKASSEAEADIVIDEHDFSMKWNLATDGNLWILKPESVNEVGCIHTCQGLELDYVGVIIGPDLIVRDGKVIAVPEARAKTDGSIKGYKKLLKENPALAHRKAEAIIKNTYRTLMTRAQKGCYIYCTDAETSAYFKELITGEAEETVAADQVAAIPPPPDSYTPYPGLTLPLVEGENLVPYGNAVPLYDLHIAAGSLSEFQVVDDCDWVALPEFMQPSSELFVAQVVGESMNKRIPNGAWCLFRKATAGTRQDKIVLVQHHAIADEDHGGRYTVKRYSSEKISDDSGGWTHGRITLSPMTNAPGYDPIIIEGNECEELTVIAEFVAVL